MAYDGNVIIANVLGGQMCELWVGKPGSFVGMTQLGYTDGGATLSVTETTEKIPADQSFFPIKIQTTDLSGDISFKILESSLANISLNMPACRVVGNKVTFGLYTTPEISMMIIGEDPNGAQRTWKIPYVRASGTFSYHYSKKDVQSIDCKFEIVGHNGVDPLTVEDSTAIKVTIASGTFAYAGGQTLYLVNGESNAADALTDIVAGVGDANALTDGLAIELMLWSASAPITVTHATGIIELDDAANFVMSETTDKLYLEYNLSATKWVESHRVS